MINTQYLKQANDCRVIAAKYTELRRVNQSESHGPCPFCGGRDRFVVMADGWFCRPGEGHCAQTGDTIKLIMLKERVDFLEACQMLGSDYLADSTPVRPAPEHIHGDEGIEHHAWRMVDNHNRFLVSDAKIVQRCRAYWLGRGFTMETAAKYKIAFGPDVWLPNSTEGHPAIALPWLAQDGALKAIKYRYLQTHSYIDNDGKEAECKNTSRGSMKGHVFGWQAFSGSKDIFIITEGELNACAIWQVFGDRADVLSAGAQGMIAKLPTEIIKLAQEYKHRLVWADEVTISNESAKLLKAIRIKSNIIGGDAADVLQAGQLDIFLSKIVSNLLTKS